MTENKTFLERLMAQPANIRNLSVIAHVDHGKSTLTDSLVAAAGIIRMKNAGETTFTDTTKEELERGITIKSTGISMPFEESRFNSEMIAKRLFAKSSGDSNSTSSSTTTSQAEEDNKAYLINLIDSPGHVDFSSEVTAALRATDGALVVVDIVEGVCVQTETVLSQALLEGIKPILCINKMDRAFLELQLSSEEIYQKIISVINSVNAVIDTYVGESWPYGDPHVSAKKGEVVFAAAKMGWAFSVVQFSAVYATRTNNTAKSWNSKLWGDNFFNVKTNKWNKSPVTKKGTKLERGFCKFILDPIQEVFSAFSGNGNVTMQDTSITSIMKTRKLKFSSEDIKEDYSNKDLLKCIMQKWLPGHRPLLEAIVNHLPSPAEAQKHRVGFLYTGPLNDETAESIKNCDANGPLCVYISKMVPDPEAKGNAARFLAFGRVFSGTIKPNMKIRILGANYNPEKADTDIFINKSVQRTIVMMARHSTTVDEVPAGNTVALVGIDQYLVKTGTLTTLASSYPMKQMKFSVSAVVQRAVAPKNPKDVTKFIEALKKIVKVDPLVKVNINDSTKEMVIAAAGELHLEILLNDLQEMLKDIQITISEPIVPFCETVTEESSITCLAKSANKHNRLYCRAMPMEEDLVAAIIEGKINHRDSKSASQILTSEFNWTKNEAKKLWHFGPEGSFNGGGNAIVDYTQSVQYLNEIKDSVGSGFQWVCTEGVLAHEELRGVKFNILNAELHADAIHRGGGQIIACARRCLKASQYTAKPTLLEPFYELDVQCPSSVVNNVRSLLSRRRGEVTDEIISPVASSVINIKASIPVMESIGLSKALSKATSGKAFPSLRFSHWEKISGDPFEEQSKLWHLVRKIRTRKGLSPDIPDLSEYLDKL